MTILLIEFLNPSLLKRDTFVSVLLRAMGWNVYLSDLMYTRIEYIRYDFSKVIGFEHLDIVFVKCNLHYQIRRRA